MTGALALAALSATATAQATWYVDPTAPAGGNGKSWDRAFRHVNGALDHAAAGDEIRVAQGRYLPDGGPGRTRFDRNATFRMVDGATLLGGFKGLAGPPGSPDDRDPGRFRTTLSGDLKSNDPQTTSDNSKHVVTFDSGVRATLDGCEIRDGFETTEKGAGIQVLGGHAICVGCTIVSNNAQDGGAIHARDGSVRLVATAVNGNHADGGHGGAIDAIDSDLAIAGCELAFDTAKEGGALRHSGGGAVTIVGSRFISNRADTGAAAIVEHGDFTRCVFDGNHANVESAALRIVGTAGGSVTVRDSLVSHNDAPGGGALHDSSPGGGAIVSVLGTTVVDNRVMNAPDGAGLRTEDPGVGSLVVRSSILWNNLDDGNHRDESAQLSGPAGAIAIDWSDVQGWTGGLGGTGDLGADPRFIAPFFGDYHLDAASPCIDAGDPAFVLTPDGTTDLDGNIRSTDARLARAELLDMGAFEFANVRLAILGLPRRGGFVTVRLDGTPGLPALLIVGTEPGWSPIAPLGAFLIDINQPTTYSAWPAAPSNLDVDIPFDLPLPAEYFVQAYVEGEHSGNLSNMVHLEIVP